MVRRNNTTHERVEPMTAEQFAQMVFEGADDALPVWSVRAALREFANQPKQSEATLRSCHQRARELAGAATRSAPPPPLVAFVSLPTTLAAETLHRGLLRLLRPWAEALRGELFGQRSAPFSGTDGIEGWLERQEPAHFGMAGARALPYLPPRRGRQLIRVVASDDTELTDVRVGRPEGTGAGRRGGRSMLVAPGSTGWRLADEAARMSHASGVPLVDLVAYVLIGKQPRVRSPEVWIRFRPHHPALVSPVLGRLFATRVVIELEESDISTDVFRALLLALQKALGTRARGPLSEADATLIEIVERLKRSSGAAQIDWRKAAEHFARATGDETSPKALLMRFRRLRARLGPRTPETTARLARRSRLKKR